ncbi:cell division transport system permease protein [Stella humosa]|uniref:Cell division transport system permease protein n=1 Tax=Stella humosa TaxID=94 RepID=A0A3N1LQA5_9PROT|nr:FtsX-like permease family protein [Stella humosa]ROP91365.1 cell division transport system permease protein [Stella humosa]BBK34275.1 cell division protein FtsX [Stella humosa]
MSGRLLGRDPVSRTMPWMVAVMAFIAALSLALALAVEAAAARFGSGLSGNVTIEVPHDDAEGAADARAAQIVAGVTKVPGVLAATIVPRAVTAKLVEPWLGADLAGSGLAGAGLPLPTLVDVRVDPGNPPQAGMLSAITAAVSPAIRIDDHRSWLDQLLGWVTAVRLGAGAVLLCALLGIVLTIALATQAALEIHREVIEILHIIGARDTYIATQFQLQALRMGLQGGAAGAGLATLLLLVVGSTGLTQQSGMMPALELGTREWIAVAILPLLAGGIAVLVARRVVLRALARMM